jgi:hypothetical protein
MICAKEQKKDENSGPFRFRAWRPHQEGEQATLKRFEARA